MTGNSEALIITFAMGAAIFFCRVFPFLFFRDTTALNADEKKSRPIKARDSVWMKNIKRRRPNDRSDYNNVSGRHYRTAFLRFVEKTVPPAAMTVLAFNSLAGPIKTDLREGIPALTAAGLTALVHLWKRNPLISIFGGTAAYMILERVIMR